MIQPVQAWLSISKGDGKTGSSILGVRSTMSFFWLSLYSAAALILVCNAMFLMMYGTIYVLFE